MPKLISACGLDCHTCECREAYLAGDISIWLYEQVSSAKTAIESLR